MNEVKEMMIALLQSHQLKSITPSLDKKFAKPHLVNQVFGVRFYFPDPH